MIAKFTYYMHDHYEHDERIDWINLQLAAIGVPPLSEEVAERVDCTIDTETGAVNIVSVR